jgi:phytoene/squalene synthetase
LQIINHLQDCKQDYVDLDRVYIPQDALRASGTTVEALGAAQASPALRQCLAQLAARTEALLTESDGFATAIADWRLALEVSVINRLAHRLTQILRRRDPLSEKVHLGILGVAGATAFGILHGGSYRIGRRLAAGTHKPRGV